MTRDDFEQYLNSTLDDPGVALEYLKAALEEKDMPELFLLALRDVARARGIRKLADETTLNRENLYRQLSRKGNPKLRNLCAILDVLGLKLSLELKKPA